jgi:hypothetical protein
MQTQQKWILTAAILIPALDTPLNCPFVITISLSCTNYLTKHVLIKYVLCAIAKLVLCYCYAACSNTETG